MAVDRKLIVRIVGDSSSLERSFRRSSHAANNWSKDVDRASGRANTLNQSLRGVLSTTGKSGFLFGSGAFVATASLTTAFKASSEAASNMAEQLSKTRVVFGESSVVVEKFARNSLALANDQALELASTFGALLRPLGISGEEAAKTSVRLTQLGVDFSSFFNTDTADALAAIQSGLVGEVEPLRRYGVLLSAARVQQEALVETGKKNVKSLTQQDKVQARIALIFRDSAQAQGDFARTSGGLANQQRELSRNIRDLEIGIGTALNPSILEATKRLNKWLSSSRNQERVTRDVREGLGLLKEIFGGVSTAIQGVDKVTGSFKNTLGLLIGLKAGSVFLKWAEAAGILAGVEGAGGLAGAASKASLLRTQLGLLSEIGPIVVGIEILIHRKDIGDKVGDLVTGLTGSRTVGDIANVLERAGIDVSNPAVAAHDLLNLVRGPKLDTPGGGDFGSPAGSINRSAGFGGGLDGLARARRRGTTLGGQFNLVELRLARAEATNNQRLIRADLVLEAGITRQMIQHSKKLKERTKLTQQLAGILDRVRGIDQQDAQAAKDAAESEKQRRKEARERARDALQGRQFRALGLDATGSPLPPGLKGLRRELGSVSSAVEGTFLDTSKTRSVLSRIRHVLSGGLGALSGEVRSTVKQMLDDIDQQLKDHSTGPQTKFVKANTKALLAGLGLDPDEVRRLRARLSQLGPAGTVPGRGVGAFGMTVPDVVVNTTFQLDGRTVAVNTTKHQRRLKQANPRGRRGTNRR